MCHSFVTVYMEVRGWSQFFISTYVDPRDWIQFSRLWVPLLAEPTHQPQIWGFFMWLPRIQTQAVASTLLTEPPPLPLWSIFKDIYLLLCVACLCESGYTCTEVCMWRWKDKIWESVLLFWHVCSGTWRKLPGLVASATTHWAILPIPVAQF